MKNNLIVLLAIGTLLISSCSRSSNNSTTWTFKSINNSAPSCTGPQGAYSAINTSAAQPDTIGVVFESIGQPVASGIYTVAPGFVLYTANQVHLTASSGGQMYTGTGGNGSNQTIQVAVSGSTITMTGSNIEMVNIFNPADSAPITFHLVKP